jgi:hypothetical protein
LAVTFFNGGPTLGLGHLDGLPEDLLLI